MIFNRPRHPARSLCIPHGLWLVMLFCVFGVPVSCGPRFSKSEITINRAGGEPVRMTVELARTDTERTRGLMNRKTLGDGKGMLFIFDRDQIMSFWMENTLIPLSIAFISKDGRILEIRDMQPLDKTLIRSSRSARYALEVPQGWFSRAGIKAGDMVMFDSN